jgi:co-chaperonin GroES (HSP10)
MSVKPLGKFILATPVEEENNQTKSGLYITLETDDKLPEAIVVEIGDGFFGPDGTKHAIPVDKGDKIVYIKGHKTDYENNGEKFVFISAESIIAVIK